MRAIGSVCVFLITSVAIAERPARAETAEQEVERLSAEAVAAYKANRFDRTVELLVRAYAIRPVAPLLYNLAKAYEKLGQEPQACDTYRKYLGSVGTDPKLLARVQTRVGECNDKKIGLAPPPAAGPSPAEIAEKEAAARLAAEKAEKEAREAAGKAEAEKARVAAERAAEKERLRREEEERAGRRHRFLGAGVALAIVGLGGIGAGLGLYAMASSTHAQFVASHDEATKKSLMASGQQQGLISTAMYAAGGVVLAISVPLIALGLHHEAAPSPSPTARPEVLPWLGPTVAGAEATWRF